jgi:hypothetical protein
MLVACRLAGLSALEGHYAGVKGRAQCGADTALPAAFIAFGRAGRTWASAGRPEAQAMDAGPPGRL